MNTLFTAPAATPATDSARPATVASLSTNTGRSMYLCISSTMGTSCQPRLVQKGTWPVRGSSTPGRPMPMAFMSPTVWPLFSTTRSASAAMSLMTASWPRSTPVGQLSLQRIMPLSSTTPALMPVPPRSMPIYNMFGASYCSSSMLCWNRSMWRRVSSLAAL